MAKVLVLRTCSADGTSYGGFRWPKSGVVKCNDWNPEPVCGGGLHGLLWGEGDGGLLDWSSEALWQVIEVEEGEIVYLGGKVKYPQGNVILTAGRKEATDLILSMAPRAVAVVGCTVSGGNGAVVSGGWKATVSGGDGATVSGGNGATVSGGDGATVSGGDGATVSGGDGATVSGGDGATVSGGNGATVSGGWGATVSGGGGATVSGGWGATVSGGWKATVSGGWRSVLILKMIAEANTKIHVAIVGENGVLPNAAYKLDDRGNFVPAKVI